MDIGEEDHIRISHDLSVRSALMLCSLGENSQIHGQRTIHDTSGDLAVFIHLCELSCLNRSGHLFIYHLYRSHGSHLGILYATGVSYADRIIYEAHLILQCGIGHKSHISQEQELLYSLYLENSHMGKRLSGTQSHFLVQYALQEALCIKKSLHIDVGLALVHQFYRCKRCLHGLLYIYHFIFTKVHADILCYGGYLICITCHHHVYYPSVMGLLCSLHHKTVLGISYCQFLFSYFSDLCQQVIKTFTHLHTPLISDLQNPLYGLAVYDFILCKNNKGLCHLRSRITALIRFQNRDPCQNDIAL